MKEYGRSGMEERGTQAEQKVEWRLGRKGRTAQKRNQKIRRAMKVTHEKIAMRERE